MEASGECEEEPRAGAERDSWKELGPGTAQRANGPKAERNVAVIFSVSLEEEGGGPQLPPLEAHTWALGPRSQLVASLTAQHRLLGLPSPLPATVS